MRTINFAIVGCGRIAQRHAEHIANAGRLAAVCDIVPERAKDLAGKHACAAFTRFISRALRRAAVFRWMMPFVAALSNALSATRTASVTPSPVFTAASALPRSVFSFDRTDWLRTRLRSDFSRSFFADLVLGTLLTSNSKQELCDYSRQGDVPQPDRAN